MGIYVGDPVASGLVSSLARPGGNVTGSTMLAPEIVRKNLQLLKEAAPVVSRVSILIDPTNPGQTLPDREMAAAAEILGVRPQRVDIQTPADLDKAFATVQRQRAQALLIYPLPLTPGEFQRITEFAIKNRLPTATWHTPFGRAGVMMFYGTNVAEQYRRAGVHIDKILKGTKPADLPVEQPTKFELVTAARQHIPDVYAFREATDEGGLMSYGVNIPGLYRRAAYFVDRILKGTQPRDLPVEQPTQFELVINMKTAKALGLTIPRSVLGRADQVIE